jgi:His/Glu/Gln/Arg/opine family amino acid ABC transporter permease subunit
MRNMRGEGGLGRRFGVLVATVLAVMALAPAMAGAVTINQSSTRPNGFAGQDTYAEKPTRLTWEASIAASDPAILGVTLELPKGTQLTNTKVLVITLEGLTRSPVKADVKASGETIAMTFAEPVQPGRSLRVSAEPIVFPVSAETFQVKGTIETSTGPIAVPPAKTAIVIKPLTLPERIIYRLDQQAWVAKWNSVRFLNMFLNPQIAVASLFLEFKGWLLSIALVAIGFPVAIPIGLALAFAKMSKISPVRWVASLYVNVIRGTPLFLQMYIAFFGLPLMGINPNKYFLGILVLALNSSAYLAEIFRAGIQSISKGQFEAASSLGMNYWQSMQYVIVPQTVKRVLPTMTSEFILLYKDTALLSAVGVFELMLYSKNLTAITGNITPYIVAAAYYLIVTTPLIRYVRNLEERLALAEGGAAASDTKPRKKKHDGKPWEPAVAGPEAGMLASSTEHESR